MDRECVPAVPKPRKRRTQSNVGESEGIPLLEFAGPSASASAAGPPPKFDPPEAQQLTYQAERGALLARHDLSHTDSRSFTALFTRGLGNVSVSTARATLSPHLLSASVLCLDLGYITIMLLTPVA